MGVLQKNFQKKLEIIEKGSICMGPSTYDVMVKIDFLIPPPRVTVLPLKFPKNLMVRHRSLTPPPKTMTSYVDDPYPAINIHPLIDLHPVIGENTLASHPSDGFLHFLSFRELKFICICEMYCEFLANTKRHTNTYKFELVK